MSNYLTDAPVGVNWKDEGVKALIVVAEADENIQITAMAGQRLMENEEIRNLIDARPNYGKPVMSATGEVLTNYPMDVMTETQLKEYQNKVDEIKKKKKR